MLLLWLALLATPAEPTALGAPVWVDQGRRIAFAGTDGVEQLWFLADADGSHLAPFRTNPPYEATERCWWSPDGARLAYLTTVEDRHMLYVHRIGAEQAEPVSVVGAVKPPVVVWGGSGTFLGFSRRADAGAALGHELFLIGFEGEGTPTRIQMPRAPTGLAWQANGRGLAYAAAVLAQSFTLGVEQRTSVFVTSFARRTATDVAPHLDVLPRSLCWTPDGKYLFFAGFGDLRQGARLFRCRPGVGQLPQLVGAPHYLSDQPILCSLDGKWLAWIAGPLSRPTHGKLYLAPMDKLADMKPVVAGAGWCSDPVFSGDSRWLACTTHAEQGGQTAVAIVQPGGTETAVFDGANSPSFAPDGKHVAMVKGGHVVVQELTTEPRA